MRAAARTIWVVVLLLLVPFAAGNWDGMRDALPLRAREMEAFHYLRRSENLEGLLVGFSGELSGGFLAMRVLHRSPYADAAFKQLVRTGTKSGQLYGLIGVRRTDPLFFQMIAHRYASNTDTVGVFSGCITAPEPVGKLVRAEGALQLARNESAKEWIDKRPTLREIPPVDIAGGAYTSMYLDRGPIDEKRIATAMRRYDFTP